jgi:L-malate glycosyltransferase
MLRIAVLADAESIHTRRWCQHFSKAGFEVHLLSFKRAEMEGVQCHFIDAGNIKVAGGNWRFLLKGSAIRSVLNKIKPDVLHALYATSYGLAGALSGFHPYVVTPLGTDVLISPKQSFIYRFALRYVFRKADLVTSMAPHMTEAMLQLGLPKEKLTDVVLGINTEVFNSRAQQLPKDAFVISSIRNLEPVYNIPHFLKAIALVKSNISNLKVNVVGQGSLKDELMALCRELQIEDVVRFHGKIPQNEIVQLLNRSHIAVTVSLSDGNALSLLESMACGVYPIASDIAANRQWLTDGLNGSLVKIDDVEGLAEKIRYVHQHYSDVMAKVTKISDKIIAEKGTWQVNMEKMASIYKNFAAVKR